MVRVKPTAIWHVFELYECRLVVRIIIRQQTIYWDLVNWKKDFLIVCAYLLPMKLFIIVIKYVLHPKKFSALYCNLMFVTYFICSIICNVCTYCVAA